jgi:hypothetical protein
MKLLTCSVLAAVVALGTAATARADEAETRAVFNKAIKALGGEAKLAKAATFSQKTKGKFSFGGNESEFTSETIVQGLARYHSTFEGEFGGNKVKGVTVLNGEEGWRKFGDNKMNIDKDAMANEKRNISLQILPVTLLPLKEKDFKMESAGDDKVGDKPAAALKFTGTDGKDFTLAFDKESGLPVKLVAKVVGFQGEEFTQETTFTGYKEFDGIQRATKLESKRNGESFLKIEVTEFKVLEKVDPKTFAEPE